MKRLLRLTLLLLVSITTLSLTSCGTDILPGERGMYYRPYSSGLDTLMVYKEGFQFHAPWNEIIKYNTRNQTINYKSKVMDKNGTEITILTNVNYAVKPNKIANLELKHGQEYPKSFINPKAYGAIKDVAGRYTYEELYSIKREALETEIEAILSEDFKGNYLTLGFVEVADVDLPTGIANEIKNKEEQKQRNLTSKLKEEEQKNLADAKIATAEGNKQSKILNAEAEAESIEIKNKALSQSPKYIELIKAEAQMELSRGIREHGIGNNNVFGDGTMVMKGFSNK